MSGPRTPREQAMAFLAAYDRPEADAYERHVVRIARLWLRLLTGRRFTEPLVDATLAELHGPVPPGYGCAWDELRTEFTAWAEGARPRESDPRPRRTTCRYEDL